MVIQGYAGICAHCFKPIENEQLFQFRLNGRNFHKNCAKKNSYYIRLEKRLAIRKQGIGEITLD